MSKLASRLLVFFIGVPVVLSFVFINICNFLPLKIVVIFASLILSLEIQNMLANKTSLQPKPLTSVLTILIPISAIVNSYIETTLNLENVTIVFAITIVLIYELFSKNAEKENFDTTIQRISSSLFVFFYAGYLMSYFINMSEPAWLGKESLNENSLLISLFFIIVFSTDSLAWLFGMLFGKNNRGLVKASPNKSIAGFVGGILGTMIVVFIVVKFFPIYNALLVSKMNLIILTSFVTSIMAIIGDLIESVIKRSANVKDSGKIIPGRGGLFDSVDSLVIAAPVFYLMIEFIVR